MKKKLIALALTLCTLLLFSMSAVAAKPSVELTDVYFSVNSANGVTPTICFRNNSGKTIKYVTFTLVPMNAVGDKVSCSIRGYSATQARLVGPIYPTSLNTSGIIGTFDDSTKRGTPFSQQMQLTTDYYVYVGERHNNKILLDKYGNPYYWNAYYSDGLKYGDPLTYLSESEIQNAVYDTAVEWDCLWYNGTIEEIAVTQAVVEYMDGSKETISQKSLYSGNFRKEPDYIPYFAMLKAYSPVYNFEYYKANNADLAALYGDNEWKYLEHFVTSGMKEGRQGSAEFNLAAYKANNADLVAAFGDNNQKYYEHYLNSGKAEGRKAA